MGCPVAECRRRVGMDEYYGWLGYWSYNTELEKQAQMKADVEARMRARKGG